MAEEMAFQASDTAKFGARPNLKRDWYAGQLVKVEERKDSEGKPFQGKYGRQIIATFDLFTRDAKNRIRWTDPDNNTSMDVSLPCFLNIEGKDKNGKTYSAVTPKGRITLVFQALGWKFDAKAVLKPNDFIGKWADLSVNSITKDYTASDGSKKSNTFSVIESVEPFSAGEVVAVAPVAAAPQQHVEKTVSHSEASVPFHGMTPEQEKKIAQLQNLVKEGLLTEEGLRSAIDNMKKGAGK